MRSRRVVKATDRFSAESFIEVRFKTREAANIIKGLSGDSDDEIVNTEDTLQRHLIKHLNHIKGMALSTKWREA